MQHIINTMKDYKKGGFTLIEIMVTIAIISLLAAVVMVTLNGSNTKAKKSAFKSEAASVQPKLISDCDQAAITAPTNGTQTRNWTVVANSCGANGILTFTANANALFDNNCKATVTETTTTFTAQCN